MASDKKPADYAALVAEAEKAVATVKDPELRRVAFEKILETLLAQEGPTSKPSKKQTRKKTASASRGATRKATKKSRKGPKAYIEELIEDGFFKKQRTISDVKSELANRGHHIPLTSLSGPLQSLTRTRKLRRQKTSSGKGAKATWAYSNW